MQRPVPSQWGLWHESPRPQIHRFRPQARAPPLGVSLPHLDWPALIAGAGRCLIIYPRCTAGLGADARGCGAPQGAGGGLVGVEIKKKKKKKKILVTSGVGGAGAAGRGGRGRRGEGGGRERSVGAGGCGRGSIGGEAGCGGGGGTAADEAAASCAPANETSGCGSEAKAAAASVAAARKLQRKWWSS